MKCECDKFLDRLFKKKDKSNETKDAVQKVSWKRSFAKAITWESCCFLILGSLVYMMTGRWQDVCTTVVSYHIFKVFFYAVHEKLIWGRIVWGIEK